MQSGGSQQGVGVGGHGGGRNSSASSAASPSSSSSAVSAPHQQGGGGGFDSSQHQKKQQQQQQLFRQSLQQQQLRKTEGDESFLAYQGRNLQGVMGGSNTPSSSGSMHSPQQLSQQQVAAHIREDSQSKVQGVEQRQHQQMPNAVQQAYMQYAFQAGQQKSGLGNLLQVQQAQAQAQQQQLQQQQQQGKMGMLGPSMGKEQDVRAYNQRMQELMSLQAANQSQGSASRKPGEQFVHGEKQIEHSHQTVSEQRNDSKPLSQVAGIGQLIPSNMMGPVQASQAQASIQNIMGNKYAMSQLKAMHAWALESNIDLSRPENCHLIPQLLPIWQARNATSQKSNEGITAAQTSRPGLKQQNVLSPTVGSDSSAQTSRLPFKQHNLPSPTVGSDSSAHGNSSSDVSGQSGSAKARSFVPGSSATTSSPAVGNPNNIQMQQHAIQSRENQTSKQPIMNGMPPMYPPQSSVNTSHGIDNSSQAKSSPADMESSQAQHLRQLQQLSRSSPQPAVSSNEGGSTSSGPSTQASQQRLGFTKQQLHVLKAQILAFRRLKRGEGSLPQEVLESIIAPPLLESQLQVHVPPVAINQDRSAGRSVEISPRQSESNERAPPVPLSNRGSQGLLKDESFTGQEKETSTVQIQGVAGGMKEPMQIGTVAKEGQGTMFPVKSEQEVERGSQMIAPLKADLAADRVKAISPPIAIPDAIQVEKPNQAGPISQSKDASVTRKYPGPLFDFHCFTRKHDSMNSPMMGNNGNNLTLAYNVKDLLMEEAMEVLSQKRAENLRKISGLLAVNLDRKRISPDLVMRLQIEEKKLRLLDLQARVRDEVDQQQQEIMAMPDRPYRKFVRLCERQRMELARQVQVSQRMRRERQLKSIFQWRKKLLESLWAIRDARTARNRGIAKYHERMLREFSKNKDDDRTKRMEALKNNDVDRYREMLLEQQTSITGEAAERYSVLSSFLSQTEEYLHKLGGKITAAKNHQEVEDAAIAAATAARSQGLSEEEVKAAAACAGEEVLIRKRFSEMNSRKESASVNKYYNLAHAVNEKVMRQPSMLRAGTLRDYQLVGLQWMLSLYNNKLNGILADEMGLGKTVQVMALIAHLMEFKGNYGPHLIIVPNAVLVNWKSELHTWLPSVSCIYYVGGKDQRAKLFSQVCALKFNVLVTTYEFIMYDRTKLSKVDWKYIIIDEAQRMKDRESVLARDLDRYRCQRRLLLTGTPLQNDLKELWSLLNLLLPEVFDNRKVFHDWFSKPFQRDAPVHDADDDWLETEKKVIIIHRLHQILEPFMLRRRIEDVEGSLPQKVSIVLRCKMSAIQGAIYDWVKATGTIRVDPEDELRRVEKNPNYTAKTYRTLQNRCMELRKTCNHPLLNYPYFNDYSKDFLVRSCGKLWILDRILMKLQRTGHRVLLFSTMTKLLDLLEEYLQWRRLIYRRIDGTTSLDDRESAIVEFNRPDTDCFIFLLSIRAAGRGLNLQTADTVVIYDPDPNPKNEEQAVARAHRIGQKREVKVIYMESVVDKVTSHQKEDEIRSGGNVDDSEDDLAGKDRYIGSIESLIRNNIQQYKIDMADEVINAGRFDQRTTHEERRMTLETLLHDEERCQETVHNVPSLQEVNRMIARSEEEVELFDQMDEEMDWAEDMTRYDQVPDWIRASSREVNAAVASLSKKPSKNGFASPAVVEPSEVGADGTPIKTERRRGRPKGSGNSRTPIYTEVDDDEEFSEASSEERNVYSLPEEEAEIEECEDEEGSPAIFAPPSNQPVEESPLDGGYELHRAVQGTRGSHLFEEAGSSGSSSGSRRLVPIVSPSMSAQKFGSLSALESRPGSLSKRLPDELEEGEIAVSGDSQMDLQQSGSWIHDREDGDDEQVLQPKLKRKRTMRTRPRPSLDRLEDITISEKSPLLRGSSSQLAYQADYDYDMQSKTDPDLETVGIPAAKHGPGNSVAKHKRNMPLRGANSSKSHVAQKPIRSNSTQVSVVNNLDHSRESWDGRVLSPSGSKMSDIIQRKCKNVVNKLQKRIDKDGPQIIPLLTDFWKRNENSGYTSGTGGGTILDLRRIDYRVERLEYNGVMDFVSDVQSMLKNVAQYFGFSYEVRSEAKKVQDLFFDIMKIAFPETDLREARNAVMFSAAAAVAPKHGPIGQSKRHKLVNEVETESVPLPKLHTRVPASADEEVRVRGPMPKFQKESRLASSSSLREPNQPVETPSFTHPGELVICKKKRNDRDKSVVKSRTAGPVSPQSVGRNVRGGLGPGSVPVPRDGKISQQSTQQNRWAHEPLPQHGGGGSGGNLGWAKPVKRMRTDTGKRRPSHL